MGSKTDGLIEDLENFRRRLQKSFAIERMILFGSRARGRHRRSGDVDIIVVSERFRGKGAIERATPLYLEWDLGLPVDFLCYTPEEFRDLSRRGGLVREALREGIPISG